MLSKFHIGNRNGSVVIEAYSDTAKEVIVVSRFTLGDYKSVKSIVSEEVETELGYNAEFEKLYDYVYYKMYLERVDIALQRGMNLLDFPYELREHLATSQYLGLFAYEKFIYFEVSDSIKGNLVSSKWATIPLLLELKGTTDNRLLLHKINLKLGELGYGKE